MIAVDWKPNKQDKTPIYRQIVKYISEKIAAGDWPIGSRLPSQRDMAQTFGINRSTVVSAMEELISYGILESDFGGGTRVASNTWSIRMSQPPDWNKHISSGHFRANLSTIQTINKKEFEPGYIRIGTGELAPELYPGKLVSRIFRRMPERIPNLGYLGPLGLPELGQALSQWLKINQEIEANPSNIMVASGSLQGLQLISVCMLKKGSRVYTEAPSYVKSLQIFQSAGMRLSGVPLDDEGIAYWNMKEADSDSLLYTIPSFHNPTSTVMSEVRRREVMQFCQGLRMPILEDDAYGQLWFDEKPPKALKARDKTGAVIYMGTISKTMAPGLRIGWVVGPEAVVYRLGDVKMQTDYGASSVSQWMMTELLTSGDYDIYLETLRRELKARRDNALAALSQYFKGLATWNTPKGGFYIWLRLHCKVSMDKVFADALKAGILLNPGNMYDYTENHAIRLSYAYADPEDLHRALKILADIIEKHRKG